jgi:hypothetical protein
MHSTVAGLRAKNQQPVYLGFWRPIALKPAPLLGVGRKCALELSNSGYSGRYNGVPWQAYVKGNNLGDQLAYAHTSFIKNAAPLEGRNLSVGVRLSF